MKRKLGVVALVVLSWVMAMALGVLLGPELHRSESGAAASSMVADSVDMAICNGIPHIVWVDSGTVMYSYRVGSNDDWAAPVKLVEGGIDASIACSGDDIYVSWKESGAIKLRVYQGEKVSHGNVTWW
jgi:hypothetical protein